ncbi:hypothetical protein M011DRAFT_492248 [Sporormia fimetaria CBS 119925]|uniref:Autophagy-related protein 1 n=1 Tax=Sporormia fimetaria CBS 119925 TaxID=1340428 RepID=A0A6A6VJU8_9PLEO|nr:hypothetical protein M011DRAFT_492248 [Sporormia fimetaria CBS 119925]
MDNEATQQTQQNTQNTLDPRRIGRNHSGLSERDVSDVLLVLHPTSPAAIKVAEFQAQHRRQHVLFGNGYDSFVNPEDIEEQETIIINPSAGPSDYPRTGADIALRMSSHLIQPNLGFVFGRNAATCDVVLAQDSRKRISNQHFRIFLNSDAILMLEDMSTNGTAVDGNVLKHRDPRTSSQRMLQSGSIVAVHNSVDAEMLKFVVRIPSRAAFMDRFAENVKAFMARCAPDPEGIQALERLQKPRYGLPAMKWDGGDRYNILGQIGKGAFATVYQLATKMDGKLLAAKELEKRRFMKNGQLDKKVDNEMQIMKSLRHPNIVEFVEYHSVGDYLYIIMEYVRQGDLQGYLNQHGSLSEDQARSVAQQILSALSYLHQSKIVHRDIKPDNILISEVEPFKVKLSDFGLSKAVKQNDSETFLKTFCGTLLYCAPEVFPNFKENQQGTKRRRNAKQQFHSYNSSVDIYSFAAVLWFCLCGKPPFKGIPDATGEAMYNNIINSSLDPNALRDAGVSEACIDLLCKMLEKDPELRPTDHGAAIPPESLLESIVEEDESDIAGEQLSQLSLHEEISASEDEDDDVLEDEEFEMLMNNRTAKKVRTDERLAERDAVLAQPVQYHHEDTHSDEESFQVLPPAQGGRPRLFGEIGESALESSGVLSAHANDALSQDDSDVSFAHSQDEAQGAMGTPSVLKGLTNRIFSSPSLLGAESLVRDLNMTSPQSPPSGEHSPAEPATPTTPNVPQHSSLENHTTGSQISEPTPKARPPTLNRQISLPKTASFFFDPYNPSTHTLEYASKVSGIDFVSQASKEAPSLPDTVRFSVDNKENVSKRGQTPLSDASYEVLQTLAPAMSIKPPPRRLGKLVTTADSFTNITLIVDQSQYSWGRYQGNTVVYEDAADVRVPKRAFVIFFYTINSQGMDVKDLSQKGEDWTKLDDLHVGIFTCATSGISINGKHLRQNDDRGRALYGHLHTGDIIQVFHDHRNNTFLKFKCDFYLGSAKHPRPAGDSFNVLVVNCRSDSRHDMGRSSAARRHARTVLHVLSTRRDERLHQMKHFWALPAFLRVALASPHGFSVFDDLLAFPQYEVVFPDTYMTEVAASSLLAQQSSKTPIASGESHEIQELAKSGKDAPPSITQDGIPQESYEPVVLRGQRYLCSIPIIEKKEAQNSTTSAEEAKAEEEKELVRAAHRGGQLLEGMEGNCIYYLSGWWSYSFCYNGEIKQFHQLPPSRGVPLYPPVEDLSVKSYILGRFPGKDQRGKKERDGQQTLDAAGSQQTLDEEGNSRNRDDVDDGDDEPVSSVARLESKGGTRYMVQRLGGGTECDLTGKDRKIEIQFHCHPQSGDRISMIKETSTCSYLMIIHTPRLCGDVAFLPPQENLAHPITCRPVISEEEVDDWTMHKLEEKIKEAERLVQLAAEDNPLRDMHGGTEGRTKRGPVIGGVEVGAKVLVGTEGKVIEKSVVAGGGKETHIATIADSSGYQMSREDMKRLSITDTEDVEKWKNKLAQSTGNKRWKLDLVETPRGREFRWIIESDDESEDEPKGNKQHAGGKGSDKEAKGKKRKTRETEEEEEESQEGSEEVYKDEL